MINCLQAQGCLPWGREKVSLQRPRLPGAGRAAAGGEKGRVVLMYWEILPLQ